MRRAIVHIGMPRTGSTSFQEMLARLRPRLASVGVCYPELAPPGSHPAADVNHHLLGRALDGRDAGHLRRDGLERLSRALSEAHADTVILSYEDFAVQRPGFRIPSVLRELFDRHGFAMEAVVVVKPQSEQLDSAYALRTQVVAEARTFRTFVRAEGGSGRYDYSACAEPWRAATRDRITAVPMLDRRSDAPLLARIVGALGLQDSLGPVLAVEDVTYVTNRSSGPVAVEAARRLRALRAHRQVRCHPRAIGHFLDARARSRGLDRESFRGDAPAEIVSVEARHAATNERFARTYWGRPWGAVVAPAPTRPANELAERPIPGAVAAQVASIVEEAVAQFGFRCAPGWCRTLADLVEGQFDHLTGIAGYPRWRVR